MNFSQVTSDLDDALFSEEVVAQKPAPANGVLTGDATFLIAINDQAPVLVTVAASSTTSNQTSDDLVEDINDALANAGLSNEIVASLRGNTLVLSGTPALGQGSQFQLEIADPTTNPAESELGFGRPRPARPPTI